MTSLVLDTFEASFRAATERSGLKVPAEQWQNIIEGQEHEISDGLYSVFEDTGVIHHMETGTGCEEYLSAYTESALQILQAKEWSVSSVVSDDDWMTANVTLQHGSGNEYQFVVDGVEDSDWVSFDLYTKLNAFSAEHGLPALVTFCSDDPYVVIAVPHASAKEFDDIINHFKEPYPGQDGSDELDLGSDEEWAEIERMIAEELNE